jgi:uncharacterized phiE125 gp8 family phage protein
MSTPTTWPYVRTGPGLPWDDGVAWYSQLVTAPTDLPLDLGFVGGDLLRVTNGGEENRALEFYIQAATSAAEDVTKRALMPQTWALILNKFPAGPIVLPRPPLIEVTSVAYYDTDDVAQTLTASPAEYVVAPSGHYSKARVFPVDGTSWPSTSTRPDAVTVTFECGYESEDDPVFGLIKTGIGIMVGELYKQRTLSVQQPNNTSAQLGIERFWRPVY